MHIAPSEPVFLHLLKTAGSGDVEEEKVLGSGNMPCSPESAPVAAWAPEGWVSVKAEVSHLPAFWELTLCRVLEIKIKGQTQ